MARSRNTGLEGCGGLIAGTFMVGGGIVTMADEGVTNTSLGLICLGVIFFGIGATTESQ